MTFIQQRLSGQEVKIGSTPLQFNLPLTGVLETKIDTSFIEFGNVVHQVPLPTYFTETPNKSNDPQNVKNHLSVAINTLQ